MGGVVPPDHRPIRRIRVAEHLVGDGHEIPHQVGHRQRLRSHVVRLLTNGLNIEKPAPQFAPGVAFAVDLYIEGLRLQSGYLLTGKLGGFTDFSLR